MLERLLCGEPGGPAVECSTAGSPGSSVTPDSETSVENTPIAYPFVPGGL